jgi:hypothetical protein
MGRRQGDAVRCLRCVPAVRCLRCGAVRRGAVQSGMPVHRTVGMSWVSEPAAPIQPADESHLALAERHTSRAGACGAVPAVRCLWCGAVRRGAVQSDTPVHRTVGMSWVSDPAAPTRPADESHLPLAEMHTNHSMSRLQHEHAFHDHVSQTYIYRQNNCPSLINCR